MKLLFALFLLAGVSVARAQEQACTEMGCVSGLTIEIAQEYHWQLGQYVFDFLLDGKPVHCRGTLPLSTCDGPNVQCSSAEVAVMENGCALPPQAQGFGSISLSGFPASVLLKVSRGGKLLGQSVFTPQYKSVQPNGSQCQPVCKQATVAMPLK